VDCLEGTQALELKLKAIFEVVMVVEVHIHQLPTSDALSAPETDCPLCRQLSLFRRGEYLEVESHIYFQENLRNSNAITPLWMPQMSCVFTSVT
jgi:hypothetical protein